MPMKVALVGPHTFSHEAFLRQWPNGDAEPYWVKLLDIPKAVADGTAAFGLLPFFNSEGREAPPFHAICDAFARSSVVAVQIVRHPVEWCALSHDPLPHKRTLYQFSQAAFQCSRWIAEEAWESIVDVEGSTAAAAARVRGDPLGVALGSHLGAAGYDLAIWQRAIQNEKHNATWFCILAPRADPQYAAAPLSLFATPTGAPEGRSAVEIIQALNVWPRDLATTPGWDFLEVEAPSASDIAMEIKRLLEADRGAARLVGCYPEYDRRGWQEPMDENKDDDVDPTLE